MTTRDEQIGRNVRRLRGDMSQQALADLMRDKGFPWSQATVWAVEKGERPLRVAEGEALTEALNLGFYSLTGTDRDTSLRLAAHAANTAHHELQRWSKAFVEAQISIEMLLQEADENDEQVPGPYADGGGWLEMTPEQIARDAAGDLIKEGQVDGQHQEA